MSELSMTLNRIYDLSTERGRICKVCGNNFLIPLNRGWSMSVCSQECRGVYINKVYACKPKCKPEDVASRIVTYRNGMNHRQQYCAKCRKTKYISLR